MPPTDGWSVATRLADDRLWCECRGSAEDPSGRGKVGRPAGTDEHARPDEGTGGVWYPNSVRERPPSNPAVLRETRSYRAPRRSPLQDFHGIITPSDLHFERHHAGIPNIIAENHELLIHGMVDRAYGLQDGRPDALPVGVADLLPRVAPATVVASTIANACPPRSRSRRSTVF